MVFIPRWEKYSDKKPSGAIEIDWAHELVDAIRRFDIFNADIDLVSNQKGINHNSVFSNGNLICRNGAWYDTGDSKNFNAITAITQFKPDSLPLVASTAGIVHKEANFQFNWNHPNATYTGAFAAKVERSWPLISYNITNTDIVSLAGTIKSNTRMAAFKNGKLLGSLAIGAVSPDTNSIVYCTHTVVRTDTVDAELHYVMLFDKALEDDAVISLQENPYQILKPRRRWFVFGGVSANIFNQSISLATTNSIIDSVNTDYNQSSILSSAYNIQTDKVVSANLNISLDSLQQLSNDSNALLNGTLTLTTKSGVSTSTLTSTTIDVFIDIANSYGVTPSVSVDYNPVINLNVANTTITDSIASLNLDISLNSLLNYLNEPSSQLEGILTLTSSSGITTSNTTLTTIDAFITLANIYGVVPSITIDYSTDINLSVLNSITNNTLLNYNVLTNLDLLTRLNTTYGAVSLPIEVLINLNSAYNIIKNVLVEYDGNINIDYKSSLNNNTNTDYSSNISLDLNNDISNIVNSDYNLNSQLDLHTNIVSNLSSVLDVSMLLNYSNSISDIASLSYDFNISLGINELISTLQQLEINPEVILNASFQNNNDTITNYNPSIELINNNSIVNNSITDYNTSVSLAVQNILSSTSGKDLVANISLIAQQGISTTQLITLEGSIDLGIINTYSNETLTTIDVNVDLTSAFLESLGTSVISQLDVSLDASYEVLTNGRNPNLVIRTNKGQEILVKAVNKDLKIQYIDRNIYI